LKSRLLNDAKATTQDEDKIMVREDLNLQFFTKKVFIQSTELENGKE